MRMSRRPARTASSTTYWIAGLSTIGSISLGDALVAGKKRVPSPAAGMTAFPTLPTGPVLVQRALFAPQEPSEIGPVADDDEEADRGDDRYPGRWLVVNRGGHGHDEYGCHRGDRRSPSDRH